MAPNGLRVAKRRHINGDVSFCIVQYQASIVPSRGGTVFVTSATYVPPAHQSARRTHGRPTAGRAASTPVDQNGEIFSHPNIPRKLIERRERLFTGRTNPAGTYPKPVPCSAVHGVTSWYVNGLRVRIRRYIKRHVTFCILQYQTPGPRPFRPSRAGTTGRHPVPRPSPGRHVHVSRARAARAAVTGGGRPVYGPGPV